MSDFNEVGMAIERIALLKKLYPNIEELNSNKDAFFSTVLIVNKKKVLDEFNRCNKIIEDDMNLLDSLIIEDDGC